MKLYKDTITTHHDNGDDYINEALEEKVRQAIEHYTGPLGKRNLAPIAAINVVREWLVKVEPTASIRWCFTCEHKPYTDGLGYEYKKNSGCEGSDHDIGEVTRVPEGDDDGVV